LSTLIVQLPPRDPVVPSQEWQLPEMPFLLLDKRGRVQRAGRSSLALLPRASRTVLMIAARDLLMIAVALPPLQGPRLRQALPNVIEDHLIQDPQTCHIAVDPAPPIDGKRVVAAIDRGWFRFIRDAFAQAGHTSLRAVPITRCLPQPPEALHALDAVDAGVERPRADSRNGATAPPDTSTSLPMVVAILGEVVSTAPAELLGEALEPGAQAMPRIEVALARGALGEGFAVPADAIAPTLAALAGDAPLTLYRLDDVASAQPAQPLPFETLARNALGVGFDLCQFEFAAHLWNLSRGALRQWRLPVALAVATLVIALIGVNAQWLMLARQRDAIDAQMTELLLDAFPNTTVVLDPADQMTRQLDQLRLAAGELAPSDFLSLSDGLARSLGSVPTNAIAAVDYRNRALDVTFKPDAKVDDNLAQRLARNGLSSSVDPNSGKWTIRSGQ
jgi:general secretion pathway protein L